MGKAKERKSRKRRVVVEVDGDSKQSAADSLLLLVRNLMENIKVFAGLAGVEKSVIKLVVIQLMQGDLAFKDARRILKALVPDDIDNISDEDPSPSSSIPDLCRHCPSGHAGV